MIDSVRMVVRMMADEGFACPIHLGVTEAGEGEDGRVRSAAGIGALLSEGIGDTIRVSLSEDPENEIPVARRIAEYFPRKTPEARQTQPISFISPSEKPDILRQVRGPLVIANMTHYVTLNPEAYRDAGYAVDEASGKLLKTDGAADIIITRGCPEVIPENVLLAVPFKIWLQNMERGNLFPLFT
jgi:(E)-4-hydroxy-3-methylbut-2-enyl-diphosphate synthase